MDDTLQNNFENFFSLFSGTLSDQDVQSTVYLALKAYQSNVTKQEVSLRGLSGILGKTDRPRGARSFCNLFTNSYIVNKRSIKVIELKEMLLNKYFYTIDNLINFF